MEATVELMKECKSIQISDKSEDKFKSKIDQVIKNKNLLIKVYLIKLSTKLIKFRLLKKWKPTETQICHLVN